MERRKDGELREMILKLLEERRKDDELRETILKLLEEVGRKGLTVGELAVRLVGLGKSVSERTVRRVLQDLLQAERNGEPLLVATTRRGQGPGRPERVYILARFLPKQTSLLDLIEGVKEAKVRALDELPPPKGQADEPLRQEELERWKTEETESVLKTIALGQLEDESLAEVIMGAASELAEQDPARLLTSMLEGLLKDIDGLARKYLELRRSPTPKNAEKAEQVYEMLSIRLGRVRSYFIDVWGLEPFMLNLPSLSDLRKGHWPEEEHSFDKEEVDKRLRRRIYGDRVLRILEVKTLPTSALKAWTGTDASVADIVIEHREGSFLPPSEVHIFTAAAALEAAGGGNPVYTDYDIFPEELKYYNDIRAAEEGFLLAERLRELFGEEDLRHARYAALSLRQYAEDLRVLRNEVRWRPMGRKPFLGLPPPVELIVRDGRLFPTVHRLKDFEADNLYGRLVRNEIARFNEMVDLVRPSGPYGHVAYTAVVKNPEFSWLSPLVFWFLYETKRISNVEFVYRAPLPDHLLAHLLFLGIARKHPEHVSREDKAFCTFGMLRRFSDIAFERNERPSRAEEYDLEEWQDYIRKRLQELNEKGQTPALEVEEYRPFLMLCAHAGVLMAYGAPCAVYRPLLDGKTSSHFLIPRLEAMAHREDWDRGDRNLTHAGRALERLLSWFCNPAHRTFDYNHTLPIGNSVEGGRKAQNGLAPLVPTVVVKAHEAATFVRTEMASAVEEEIRRLIREVRSRYLRMS
jgi:hypothetical protein